MYALARKDPAREKIRAMRYGSPCNGNCGAGVAGTVPVNFAVVDELDTGELLIADSSLFTFRSQSFPLL